MKSRVKSQIVLVMGVSGSGKSTFGSALAAHQGWAFADADDYHPNANREKMARGEALNDADREPWLQRLHALLEQALLGQPQQQNQDGLVLACSALKASYREILIGNLEGVRIVSLEGSRELIAERMRNREHFMPVSLLETQLATLEPPTNAIIVNIGLPIETMLEQVIAQLGQ
jgi:gluconokinase